MPDQGRSRRLPVALSAVVVLLLVGIGGAAVWHQASTSDDHSACPDAPTIPAGLSPSDVRLTPFSSSSPWNQQVSATTGTDSIDTDLTAAFRAGTATGAPDSVGSVHTWVNSEQYSLPIYQARTCDPIVTFVQEDPSEDFTATEVRIPADAEPSSGTDSNVLVVQPDGHTLVEIFQGSKKDDHTWKTSRVELVDLKGTGMGPDNGVRAFGGSAYGGLIRNWEVDPLDPNYAGGTINHGLAIAVPNSMLYYAGGDPGRDDRGYGTHLGYVAPATEQDFDSQWTYQGIIPMGSRVILPASVDVASLGLGPEVTSIALAMQRYGGYIVDRAGDGVVTFYAEPGVPATWLDGVRRQVDGVNDLDVLRSQLVIIPPG